MFNAGGDLLSHTLPGAVPSAQVGLATGFGKGPGVTPPPKPPTNLSTKQPHTHPNHHHTGGEQYAVPFQTLHNGRENSPTLQHMPHTNNHQRDCLMCNARSISTGHLHHSHGFQIRPINPVVYREPHTKPHLETGFPLRCFQRLSLPYVANQPCHGRDNWPTRGMSNPVLSY